MPNTNDKFKIIEFIILHPPLFTVFGVFGAIAIYLNSLQSVNDSNYTITFNNINSSNIINDNYNILNGILSMNISLMQPSNNLYYNSINTFILNIGILSTLTIFILLGILITNKYIKYNIQETHIYNHITDSIFLFTFLSIILVISLYILYNLIFNNNSFLLVLCFTTFILFIIMSRYKPNFKFEDKNLISALVSLLSALVYAVFLFSLIPSFLLSLLLIVIKILNLHSYDYLNEPIINGLYYNKNIFNFNNSFNNHSYCC